jgi:hypothetical protein
MNSQSGRAACARSGLSNKIMTKKFLAVAIFILGLMAVSFAQSVHTPEKGSAERKAILDVLRVPVEKALKQKIVFSIDHFNVAGNWAFLAGAPQNESGGKPDYSKTEYKDALDAGMFDNNFFALLKKTRAKWKVVKYQIGCTDVCYLDWWKDYRAPKAIFPGTE